MSLVTCPDCSRQHSDSAAACPQCGRPTAVASRSPVHVVPVAPGPKSSHACPQCGSENARKLSIIYREGMSRTQTSTGGMIYGGGGSAAIGSTSTGTAQSLSSAGAAPPEQKSVGCFAIGSLVVGAMVLLTGLGQGSGGSIVVGLLMTGIAAWFIYTNWKWNQEEYPGLYAHWDATFQCGRCELRFVPGK